MTRKKLTTADRVVLLMALVPYLRDNGPTPVPELAETFDVDAEQLRRLFRFLGTAGVPGETRTYQYEDLFEIDWDALELSDIANLVTPVAIDDAPRFAPAETAALIAGLYSLTEMLPAADAEVARRTAEKLSGVQGPPAQRATIAVTAEPQDRRVPSIIAALDAGQRLAFDYRDAHGATSSRTVDPIRLSQGAGVWYLHAYCHDREDERVFRVDRMSELRMLAERAEHSVGRERGTHADRSSTARSGIEALARVRESALPRIAGFDPEVVEEIEPGLLRVRVRLGHPGAAAVLAQHALGELVVEGPEEAREAVRTWADQSLAQYDL